MLAVPSEMPGPALPSPMGAVDLDFGGVAPGGHLGGQPGVALLPRSQLLGAEGVGEGEHRALVGVLRQRGGGDGA